MPSPFQDLQVLSALYCDSRERGLPLFPDTHPTVSEVPMMKSFRFALALVFSLTVPALGGAQEPVSGIVARSASMSKDQPKDDGLLEQPSGLDVDDVSLTDALARLRQTAGVAVAYSPSLIPSDLTVSCPCGSLSVGEAMRTMLAGTGFEFSVVADHLVVRERSASPRLYLDGLQAPASPDMETIRVETSLGSYRPAVQEGRITGRVLDARTNSPVSEAQVFIPGTGIGMLTPEGGRYLLLSVPVGTHTLRVERIGYTSQEAVVTVEEDALVQQDFRLESEAVGLDVDDRRFESHEKRCGAHRLEMMQVLEARFRTKPSAHWKRGLAERRLPADVIETYDYPAADPDAAHNRYILALDHPTHGPIQSLGFPIHMSESPARLRRLAPCAGQHGAEILHERLGYDDAAIATLERAGVLGGGPES